MIKQEILQAIYKEIDNLPPIPENIKKVKELIKSPYSSIRQIATLIKRDPALTANLLRIANSAWYSVMRHVDTVDRAITIIGLKQLSNTILAISAKKILSERYNVMEDIWEESYKCAFYSQLIMKMKSKSSEELEAAYTAGLLHNIGKIILLTLSPELYSRIGLLSEKKNMDRHIIEKLSIGINHAEIGAKITEKWEFPKHIVNTISYHISPKLVNDHKDIPLTYTVYSARIFSNITTLSEPIMDKFEPKVLEYFGIDEEEQLIKLTRSLKQFYARVGKLGKT